METLRPTANPIPPASLETFLRGMETLFGVGGLAELVPLKPSLEGWKRIS